MRPPQPPAPFFFFFFFLGGAGMPIPTLRYLHYLLRTLSAEHAMQPQVSENIAALSSSTTII